MTGRELKISRILNAPIELVWEVLTNPDHVKNWWGPDGFTNSISVMDVHPGGKWDLIMHGPDGRDYENHSVFREIVNYKRIVFEHLSFPRIIFTIEFEKIGSKTRLNWHMLFDSVEIMNLVVRENNAAEGLRQNIEKLSIYLSRQFQDIQN